jgi:hypothetical protein
MRVKFDLEAPGPNAAGSVSIRSIVGEAAVSTLERIDTVKLRRRCAAEYCLQRTVLGSLHYLQVAGAVGHALTDPARNALHRSS